LNKKPKPEICRLVWTELRWQLISSMSAYLTNTSTMTSSVTEAPGLGKPMYFKFCMTFKRNADYVLVIAIFTKNYSWSIVIVSFCDTSLCLKRDRQSNCNRCSSELQKWLKWCISKAQTCIYGIKFN
jgi:hypothetical protein